MGNLWWGQKEAEGSPWTVLGLSAQLQFPSPHLGPVIQSPVLQARGGPMTQDQPITGSHAPHHSNWLMDGHLTLPGPMTFFGTK